ncbi:MAG: radical SAM protein [Candidatus Omnitrophica bacterium]|nr:radical SAM protein [Candidatus Omnitrophota bacterium]
MESWILDFDRRRDFSAVGFRSACYAPFVSMNFTPWGTVQVCCENSDYIIGNVAEDTLMDLWNGPAINQIRSHLVRYEYGMGCEGCARLARMGAYPYSFHYEPANAPTLVPKWPYIMEFRLTNDCNFACIMCSGSYSSQIRAKRDKLPPLPRAYGDRFFEELEEFVPHLRHTVFAGGEPLIIPEHFRVWDIMLRTNPKCTVTISTNGSVVSGKALDYMQQLHVNHLDVSVDGATKKTFEAIRPRSCFEKVMANLGPLSKIPKRINDIFSLTLCAMPQNFFEIKDIFLLAEEYGAHVYINLVRVPNSCSLASLAPKELETVFRTLDSDFSSIAPTLSPFNKERFLELLSAVKHMRAGQNPVGLSAGVPDTPTPAPVLP